MICKRIEELFGWSKVVSDLREAHFVWLVMVSTNKVFTLVAYNLTRMATIFS